MSKMNNHSINYLEPFTNQKFILEHCRNNCAGVSCETRQLSFKLWLSYEYMYSMTHKL